MARYYKDIDGSRMWYKGVIRKNGRQTFTWDEALILADGWTKYEPAPVPPYVPTYEERVHELIRQRYTENDELQILREKAARKEGAAAAFTAYNAYVEQCLEQARNETSGDGE